MEELEKRIETLEKEVKKFEEFINDPKKLQELIVKGQKDLPYTI